MAETDTVDKQPELKRVMGPGLLLLFIVGDILGTGVYALTGDVAAEVGGAAWVPFLVAFLIATVTAFSYLELVTKYPQAAGAALYAHKAFGIQFVDVPGRVRGDVFRHHLGLDGVPLLRLELLQGLRLRLGQGRNRRAWRCSSWSRWPSSTCAGSARASSSTWS